MAKVKARDLRQKKKGELEQQLTALKEELAQLRVAQVTGGAPAKLSKIKEIRRSIARVYTVINENQRTMLREFYKRKPNNRKPLDLRRRLTRALRRELPVEKRRLRTIKQQKKLRHFPIRKYAVKA